MDNTPQSQIETTRCILWNANSLHNKQLDLQRFLVDTSPAIVFINETNIKANQKQLSFRNYRTLTAPSTDKKRGLAILIHKTINYTRVEVNTSVMETLAVFIDDTTYICEYQKPGTNLKIEDLELIFRDDKVILAGDLNAKSPTWNCTSSNAAGKRLQRYIDNNDLDLHIPDEHTRFPWVTTHNPSTLDIVITKNTTISQIKTIFDLSSDHNSVLFELKAPIYGENHNNLGRLNTKKPIGKLLKPK